MAGNGLGKSIILACTLALILILPRESAAQNRSAVESQFRSWLEQTIWPKSRAMGISRKTFDAAFTGVTLDWDLPDLVPPGSKPQTPKAQRQAEFGSPGAYFNAKTVAATTETGRQMARKHAQLLAQLEARYGVPGHILLAIWGRESGYGRVAIKYNAFRVLGTKGFMSTRAPYFTDELLAALQIAEAGHVAPQAMKSSWAGALGQPQFMPTNFLKYAADGDGDGKDDIWSSEADTLASIAHYLSQHGWVKGRDWGFEITLPASVSCALEGPDQGRKILDWAALGITRISGKAFPANEMQGDGFLMLPAGRNGPAFLVTPNFYVLKAYNMSDLYALFIGHIGDRIAYGAKDFSGKWGKVGGLYRSDVAAMQRALEKKGHDVGGADGLPGFKTRRSIGRWQEASGEAPTCFPEAEMKGKLR